MTPQSDLQQFILKAEEYMWTHPSFLSDFLQWVRFTEKEKMETSDGFHWKNLCITWFESKLLHLLRWRIQLLPMFLHGRLPLTLRAVAARQLKSSAGVLLFTVNRTDKNALVALGQAGLHAWLLLNKAGYGVQPMTACSLAVFDSATGVLPHEIKNDFRNHFANGRDVWQHAVGYSPEQIPAWCFRVGLSSPLPTDRRTRRREPQLIC